MGRHIDYMAYQIHVVYHILYAAFQNMWLAALTAIKWSTGMRHY